MPADDATPSASETLTRASARFGFWASLTTGVSTLVTFVIAVATPPLSGPLCEQGCYRYPYADIGSRFPRDYVWMFVAVPATLAYVAFMLALLDRARKDTRLVAQLGVVLAIMAALTLLADYVVQLAVIQPSVLAGEADGVALLSQYNPHGIFIALEELGYVLMSASMACMAPGLLAATRLERAVRGLFVGGFAVCLMTLAWFLARYGHGREYRFEIAVISIAWLTLIPSAFSMAAVYRHELSSGRAAGGG